jgi:LPS export ABC transporter protein LptC
LKRLLPVLLAAALAACSPGGTRESAPGISIIRGLSVSETDGPDRKWVLDSELARMDEKKGITYFTAPHIKFYTAGAVSSVITSRSGFMQMRKKAAELTGDVHVNSQTDGMLLLTTRLYYSSARGKIWTEEPVTIYKEKTIITGKGFTANPDLSEIEIEHQETRMRPG